MAIYIKSMTKLILSRASIGYQFLSLEPSTFPIQSKDIDGTAIEMASVGKGSANEGKGSVDRDAYAKGVSHGTILSHEFLPLVDFGDLCGTPTVTWSCAMC